MSAKLSRVNFSFEPGTPVPTETVYLNDFCFVHMVAGFCWCSIGVYSGIPYEFQLAVGYSSDYSLTSQSVSSTGCGGRCDHSTGDFPKVCLSVK